MFGGHWVLMGCGKLYPGCCTGTRTVSNMHQHANPSKLTSGCWGHVVGITIRFAGYVKSRGRVCRKIAWEGRAELIHFGSYHGSGMSRGRIGGSRRHHSVCFFGCACLTPRLFRRLVYGKEVAFFLEPDTVCAASGGLVVCDKASYLSPATVSWTARSATRVCSMVSYGLAYRTRLMYDGSPAYSAACHR